MCLWPDLSPDVCFFGVWLIKLFRFLSLSWSEPKFKNLNFLFIFIIIFLFDRLSKFYILNLAESGEVDIYINTYINFYLIWNKGVGYGLLSSDEIYLYNIVTALIIIINLVIIYFIFITKDFRAYFFFIFYKNFNLIER